MRKIVIPDVEKAHPVKDVPLKLPVASEAIAAQDGSVGTWLERHLARFTTVCTNCVIHLTRCVVAVAAIAGTASGCALTSDAARFATLRFVRKTFFGEKLLLVGSKGEFLSAIFADDGLVAVHLIPQIKYCMVRKYTTQVPLYCFFLCMSIKCSMEETHESTSSNFPLPR